MAIDLSTLKTDVTDTVFIHFDVNGDKLYDADGVTAVGVKVLHPASKKFKAHRDANTQANSKEWIKAEKRRTPGAIESNGRKFLAEIITEWCGITNGADTEASYAANLRLIEDVQYKDFVNQISDGIAEAEEGFLTKTK